MPSMLDLVTRTDEAMDAAIALAAVTEAAVGKVNEVLVKMATVNVEDSRIAAWAATVTSRDARLFVCVRAVQAPRRFWVLHHGDSSVSRRGRHGFSRCYRPD